MTIAFDTLAYAERLEAAGFTHDQARVQAEALVSVVSDSLATKQDLKELEAATKQDLKELETELKRDLAALSDKLTIRLGGMIVLGIAALAAVVSLT